MVIETRVISIKIRVVAKQIRILPLTLVKRKSTLTGIRMAKCIRRHKHAKILRHKEYENNNSTTDNDANESINASIIIPNHSLLHCLVTKLI